MRVTEADVPAGDGRTLHVYDTGPGGAGLDGAGLDGAGLDGAGLTVFWLHGTPNIGEPPEPLFAAAARHGIRWVSYDRPGYGGSTPHPGRTVGSAAADVSRIADALGLGRFAVMGHSGGGTHALACGALLPERVLAVVSGSGLAPFGAAGLDWFAGVGAASEATLRAALRGRAALAEHYATASFDPEMFTGADLAALDGPWGWLGEVAGKAAAGGLDAAVDDNLAYVAPWGFTPGQVTPPVLFLHGGQDRIVPSAHGAWLAARCPAAELWLRPDDGHVSVLGAAPAALDWLAGHA